MTDAQDTIELPVFGLTLSRHATEAVRAYSLYDASFAQRAYAAIYPTGWYMTAVVRRAPHGSVQYSTCDAPSMDEACQRLLAQMTPDDVAAIRALGERS